MLANSCKATKLVVNNYRDGNKNITGNSDNKSNNDCANVCLSEFRLHIKTSLKDYMRETYHR